MRYSFKILPALHPSPPGFILQIPVDCTRKSFLEGYSRHPTPLCLDLCGIQGVAWTVFDEGDEAFWFAKHLEDPFDDIDICLFLSTANVVDLTWLPFLHRMGMA